MEMGATGWFPYRTTSQLASLAEEWQGLKRQLDRSQISFIDYSFKNVGA